MPDPFDAAQQEALSTMIGNTVNSMFTARLKTFEAQLQTKLAESFGKTLDEKLASFKPAKVEEEVIDPKTGKGKDVAIATMQKTISDMQTRLNEEGEQRKAAEQRIRARDLESTVKTELAAHKIEGTRANAAYAFIRDRIVDDADTQSILWREGAGDPIDLKTGLKGWIKGEEAQIFLPPTGARGTGSRPVTGQGGGSGGTLTRDQAVNKVWDDIGNAIGQLP